MSYVKCFSGWFSARSSPNGSLGPGKCLPRRKPPSGFCPHRSAGPKCAFRAPPGAPGHPLRQYAPASARPCSSYPLPGPWRKPCPRCRNTPARTGSPGPWWRPWRIPRPPGVCPAPPQAAPPSAPAGIGPSASPGPASPCTLCPAGSGWLGWRCCPGGSGGFRLRSSAPHRWKNAPAGWCRSCRWP